MISKILKKIEKELIFWVLQYKSGARLEKRVSVIGPQYFCFGKNIHIGKYYRLHCFDDYSSKEKKRYSPELIINNDVHIADFFTVLNAGLIEIGEKCLFASNVLICNLNHGMIVDNNISYMDQPLTTGKISIGRNCWIGEKVIILTNVNIGDNCIIGAGSVVTKSIPSNSIAMGNPARVIKQWDSKMNSWVKVGEKI